LDLAALLGGRHGALRTVRGGDGVPINLDIPCDVQGRDADGHLWAFLDEAANPDVIAVGAVVTTGDPDNLVVARVVDITDRPSGRRVVMELLGDAS
jgi:hypothetical protein